MLLSTTTNVLGRRFGEAEAIKILAQAGFDAFDYCVFTNKDDSQVYGDNYKEYIAELAQTAKKYNIICNQAHAHFPAKRWGDEEYNKAAFAKVIRGMEAAAMLGAKVIVVHPLGGFPEEMSEEDVMEKNIEFYNSLLPYCKKFNIKVALENVFIEDKKRGHYIGGTCGYGKDFKKYMDNLDPTWFVACLDVGHISISGEEAYDAIRVLGKKHLHALHIHDNDYLYDSHRLPYTGKFEWEKILTALAEIGYEDDFTFEADNFLGGFPNELLPEASAFMCKVGRYMIQRIEEEKRRK